MLLQLCSFVALVASSNNNEYVHCIESFAMVVAYDVQNNPQTTPDPMPLT